MGHDGVSDAFVQSLEEAFRTRELLKIKVLESAPDDARASADAVAERLARVEVVQTIGRTVALYRPYEEDPEIRLPG